MSPSAPRVSVLIPNYNNGKASSCDGRTDLIADLLQSLHDTLHDDPTPVEIIVYDDGSTDDGLQTLRDWADRTWRGGEPFLTLIEEKHCGILSVGANRLVRASKGEFLARLDGDTQMLTRHWASVLCRTFEQGPPRLGMVGPKQLRPDGKVHAFGDWLLHPKGYHHIEAGADRDAITQAIEVDHVMGCFYCCKRAVYDEVGGYDESILRGQTIDFGLTARLRGWSCWAIPQIEYIHRHGLRGARQTKADTQEGVQTTLDTFRKKWGFCRLSPDLDVIRRKFNGTPLLWNAQVFGIPPEPAEVGNQDTPALSIEQSEWSRYGKEPAYKQATDLRIAVALQIIRQFRQTGKVAVLGCGAGLTTHLLAGQGVTCLSIDTDPAKITLANQCITNQAYPGDRPVFAHQSEPGLLPLTDGSASLALCFDLIESHPNPVALLREIHRVLTNEGLMVIVTRRPNQARSLREAERCYRATELLAQLNAVGGWQLMSDPRQGEPAHPLILIARRIAQSGADVAEPSHEKLASKVSTAEAA
jgi:SAM-dependent methyltransferase/GT2 family glycosyltransferase